MSKFFEVSMSQLLLPRRLSGMVISLDVNSLLDE